MATTALEIRRLTYADLPAVIALERRAFPTPWSLAMFVLELSKPSGICLAAMRDERLAGYLICSRYDRVWHIMNVAVDPDHRRQGLATALLNRLLERVADGGGEDARFTLEVRRSNGGAIELYERFGFKVAGLGEQPRGVARARAGLGIVARLELDVARDECDGRRGGRGVEAEDDGHRSTSTSRRSPPAWRRTTRAATGWPSPSAGSASGHSTKTTRSAASSPSSSARSSASGPAPRRR